MFNGLKVFRPKEIEEHINKWLAHKKYRIAVLFPLLVLIGLTSHIPFLSLLSDPYLLALIACLLTTFLLKIEGRLLVAFGVSLFVPVFALWLLKEIDYANNLADFIYILLLSGTLQIFLSAVSDREEKQARE